MFNAEYQVHRPHSTRALDANPELLINRHDRVVRVWQRPGQIAGSWRLMRTTRPKAVFCQFCQCSVPPMHLDHQDKNKITDLATRMRRVSILPYFLFTNTTDGTPLTESDWYPIWSVICIQYDNQWLNGHITWSWRSPVLLPATHSSDPDVIT
jgi:hypothetical protein